MTFPIDMPPSTAPLINEPVLIVEHTIRVLVVADIHLGIEWDLKNSGINVPSQTQKGLTRVIEYIDAAKPDRIILLGDVKHNIPQISWQERVEVPQFLEGIARKVSVDIVPGNHDGDMEYLLRLLPGGLEVKLHSSKGFVLDGVGYFHGHTWPALQLLECQSIIMAHNHPTIRFADSLGSSTIEPVWIRTTLSRTLVEEYYAESGIKTERPDPHVIIMPAFCGLCGGVPFNESLHEDLLGPVFSSESIDLDGAQAYLLDGTRLGKLGDLRKLNITKKRNPRRVRSRGKVFRSA